MGWWVLLALVGCRPNFYTVDEACPKRVRGERKLSETDKENADAVKRVACYRRLVKLPRGRVDPELTEAVAGHVKYLADNDIPVQAQELVNATGSFPLALMDGEDPGLPGFTGDNYAARYDRANFDFLPGSNGVWLFYDWAADPDDLSGADIVDEYMHSPYIREALLQPEWAAAGVAEHTGDPLSMWEMDIVYEYPAGSRTVRKPIVYPKDGQRKVPIDTWTWVLGANEGSEPQATVGVFGYPITIIVGSDDADAPFETPNPYQLISKSAKLVGPREEMALHVIEPYEHPKFSLVFLPVEPLEPNSKYYFEAEIESVDGENTVEIEFFTSDFSVVDDLRQQARMPADFRVLPKGHPALREWLKRHP